VEALHQRYLKGELNAKVNRLSVNQHPQKTRSDAVFFVT